MDLYSIVLKLSGPINPVGETNEDNKRFENLKQVTALVDKLLFDIEIVSRNYGRQEYSINRAGEHAVDLLNDIKNT